MNCDQAFEYLTDSARRDSSALARHLAGCARCRQLRETLEPALDMFEDLVPEPGIGAIEPTSPAATEDAVRIAEQSAARLAGGRFWSDSGFHGALRYAAVFLMGAIVALALTEVHRSRSAGGSICAWKNRNAASENDNLDSRAVVLSCVGCHLQHTSSDDGTSMIRLESFRRAAYLRSRSRDWFRASQSLEADHMLASDNRIMNVRQAIA